MGSGNSGNVRRGRLGVEPQYKIKRQIWKHEDWLLSFLHGVFTVSPQDGECAGISNSG